MTPRKVSVVVRKIKLGQLDEHAESLAYWSARSVEEKVAEFESLRRMWIELTGDPDAPIERVVHRRRLGDAAVTKSES